jgi:hypothetical protein
MAKRWQLPEEFVSVCGQHHDYRSNEGHGRSAGLVTLAHKLDLYLTLGNIDEYWLLTECDEMAFLNVPSELRYPMLMSARDAFDELRHGPEPTTEAA